MLQKVSLNQCLPVGWRLANAAAFQCEIP
jgi:hypothetical protein